MSNEYKSQAARDAKKMGYGDERYWRYLDDAAQEHYEYFKRHGDEMRAAEMLTRSLGDALRGNNGQ